MIAIKFKNNLLEKMCIINLKLKCVYTYISIGTCLKLNTYIYIYWSFLVEWKFILNISSVKVKTKMNEKIL